MWNQNANYILAFECALPKVNFSFDGLLLTFSICLLKRMRFFPPSVIELKLCLFWTNTHEDTSLLYLQSSFSISFKVLGFVFSFSLDGHTHTGLTHCFWNDSEYFPLSLDFWGSDGCIAIILSFLRLFWHTEEYHGCHGLASSLSMRVNIFWFQFLFVLPLSMFPLLFSLSPWP